MKFQIKNRFTGNVQFECELEARFDSEPYSIQLGAAVRIAVSAGANLAGADLAGANLVGAYLAGAKTTPATPDEIERLDAVREIVLKNTERLKMSMWHSENWAPEHTPEEKHACGSAHCIAGWLQALSPDINIRKMDPEQAGAKLAPCAAHMFTTSDAVALQWLKDRAYAAQ